MAAEIQRKGAGSGGGLSGAFAGGVKPVLISRIEGSPDEINGAVIIKDDGVISICEDRSIRVWQKRDSGQYWPSICHFLPSSPSCLTWQPATRRLLVGQHNGTISVFIMAEDFNSMTLARDILAHRDRVTDIVFSLNCEMILSVSRDKFFKWHCSESGQAYGSYMNAGSASWLTSLAFDEISKYAFLGDLNGQIDVLKLLQGQTEVVTTLRGHSASIRRLCWDAGKKLLFSAAFDSLIIAWDIGGQKGTAYELQGHNGRVMALTYSNASQTIISGGDDSVLGFWDMSLNRAETPNWAESDICQRCDSPFFWAVKKMFEDKTVGRRQHHCRKCGKAVCDNCSSDRSPLPIMGYELRVRLCKDCFSGLTPRDLAPRAAFHDSKHQISCVYLEEARRRLLTVGRDRVIKVWDLPTGVF